MKNIIHVNYLIILGVMIIRDTIFSGSRTTTDNPLPGSKTLQAVMDLTVKIFHGQGVSAAIVTEGQGYWSGNSG